MKVYKVTITGIIIVDDLVMNRVVPIEDWPTEHILSSMGNHDTSYVEMVPREAKPAPRQKTLYRNGHIRPSRHRNCIAAGTTVPVMEWEYMSRRYVRAAKDLHIGTLDWDHAGTRVSVWLADDELNQVREHQRTKPTEGSKDETQ